MYSNVTDGEKTFVELEVPQFTLIRQPVKELYQMPEAIGLLTTSEAAAAIGCSYRTVQRGIKAGSIAAVRISRRVFVPEGEVAKIREAGLPSLPSQLDQSQATTEQQ